MSIKNLLSLENDVFVSFLFYAGLILMKTILMSPLTSYFRVCKNVFVQPEDYTAFVKDASKKEDAEITITTDIYIERIRRCHLNDIENNLPFVLLGLLYVLTGPSLFAANLHFRIYFLARMAHTVVYLKPIPQPARFFSFLAGFGVNFCLALRVILITLF